MAGELCDCNVSWYLCLGNVSGTNTSTVSRLVWSCLKIIPNVFAQLRWHLSWQMSLSQKNVTASNTVSQFLSTHWTQSTRQLLKCCAKFSDTIFFINYQLTYLNHPNCVHTLFYRMTRLFTVSVHPATRNHFQQVLRPNLEWQHEGKHLMRTELGVADALRLQFADLVPQKQQVLWRH